MRLLQPLVTALARRPHDTLARAAEVFALSDPGTRRRVEQLGATFLSGYHAMLQAPSAAEAFARGVEAPPLWRPFWMEGAAMGLLPRGLFDARCRRSRLDALLRTCADDFLYLGYVGLGFWYGLRWPRSPERLERDLAHAIPPLYVPLLWDGFGFAIAFFHWRRAGAAARWLDPVPPPRRSPAWQGFGRASFFVLHDDAAALEALRDEGDARAVPGDVESGRSLALAFTSVEEPERIVQHLESARDRDELAARLAGVTWALTARWRADPLHLRACLVRAPAPWPELLLALPAACLELERSAHDYRGWREASTRSALELLDRAGSGKG